ncbi:glycerophosphodiester phosphodiesterase [Streptomyces shenzhenensis]
MSDHVLRIAHRGAPFHHRENTIGSVLSAFERGADLVEVDVKVTADGIPVVLHDHTLHRLWDLDAAVTGLPLAQLPGRDLPLPQRLPTLDELLGAVEGTLLLDLPSALEADAVLARNVHRLAVTGDPEALALVRAARPDAMIALSWDEPGLPDDTWMRRVRPDFVNRPHELVDATEVEAIVTRGSRCSTYTVDTEARVRELRGAGVHAVISNDIDMLARVLP